MSLPTPTVFKIRQPKFPQFLFEYHEDVGRVYVVGLPGRFVDGEFVPDLAGHSHTRAQVLSEHCPTHGHAYGFVQTYLRGYRQGLADQQLIHQGEAVRTVGYEHAGLGGPPVHSDPHTPGKIYG